MQAAEIELKFPVADASALRRAAVALGFALLTERAFESNTLYDTADRTLRGRREILRLRLYNHRWTLTHKAPRPQDLTAEAEARYKTRIETESAVEDGEALAAVFAALGYTPVFRYEKFREEWADATGHLVIDETPIGIWAELEGPPEWIDARLEALGINPGICSTDSYGKLFLRWKNETGSPAEHLTFDEVGALVA